MSRGVNGMGRVSQRLRGRRRTKDSTRCRRTAQQQALKQRFAESSVPGFALGGSIFPAFAWRRTVVGSGRLGRKTQLGVGSQDLAFGWIERGLELYRLVRFDQR